MKVYYAHCMALYGTPQEQRDIELLEGLGYEVVNPSSPSVVADLAELPSGALRMAYFERFADECDLVAFRALPDLSITSGVAKELGWFQDRGKPILELPSGLRRRFMSLEATRDYLCEVGQR